MVLTSEQLSTDQAEAVSRVRAWMRSKSQQLTLGGYAGSGKSTITSYLWPELRSAGAVVATPSAKAACVVRDKGIDRVSTIHSLIYNFKCTVETYDGKEKPIFEDKADGEWGVDFTPRLIVVDEASMCNQQTYDDLMAKGVPVLFVGDMGQLAPVGGDPEIMRDPDIKLTTIHRQALDSPGLRLAHHVRKGGAIDRKFADGDQLKIGSIAADTKLIDYCLNNEIDQVIVGVNGKTVSQHGSRHRINALFRESLGFKELLCVGDRLICKFNNRRERVYNGQIFRVEKITAENADHYVCDLSTEGKDRWMGLWRGIKVQKISLGNPDYRSTDRVSGCCEFDYGYGITGHASQGSQWRRVCVVDRDVSAFDMRRWRYTTLTRFSEHLSVVLR